MCDCDCEPIECYQEREVTVRKKHRCTGLCEGKFQSWYTCAGCFDLWKCLAEPGACRCFHGLQEELSEAAHYNGWLS